MLLMSERVRGEDRDDASGVRPRGSDRFNDPCWYEGERMTSVLAVEASHLPCMSSCASRVGQLR